MQFFAFGALWGPSKGVVGDIIVQKVTEEVMKRSYLRLGSCLPATEAMITGRKQVENRSWRIPAGWCLGRSKDTRQRVFAMRAT